MNIAARLRARRLRASRVQARNRRAIDAAIANAATPAMRHELIAMAQQQMNVMR
jgi:hypothetical protein